MPKQISFRQKSTSSISKKNASIGLLLVGFVFVAIYLLSNKNNNIKITAEKSPVNQLDSVQVRNMVSRVSKVTPVKTDTPPVITEIVEVDTLREGQPFYKDAQNGDKLLIFAQDKKVIIYRPSTEQVINIGSLTSSR